jgi:hypothetical protein
MRTLAESEFLRWCAGRGISPDPRYPQSAVLSFLNGSGDARFWCVPADPRRRPYFLTSLLELMGDWTSCFAWRHSGSWPDIDRIDPQRANDVVEHLILKGLGLPVGAADIVEFPRTESGILLTLLFSTTIFGWSVAEDLYVVPDHANCILQTDHHDVIHVEFRDAEDVAPWVAGMAERGFPLPDELPDETFKRPAWMPES